MRVYAPFFDYTKQTHCVIYCESEEETWYLYLNLGETNSSRASVLVDALNLREAQIA